MSVGELRPPVPVEDPLIGKVVSERYRVIAKLGEGGMGAVYLAEHVFIEKKVALKVLSPELSRRADLAARFLQEAKSASKIGHENVIDISDFGQSPEGFVYIAMEYLAGGDLGAAVRDHGPMAWPRAKHIFLQICKALRAAHQQGIVHRDMKPENIFLIQREGRPDFVKLLDFGIAKVMGMGDNVPRLTRTGMIFGTPEYMAPEQAEGKDADHRVDVYAAGCVLYHLVSGQTPFAADSFMAMLTKHILEEPVAPSVRRPDLGIAPEVDAVVLRALEKERDKRFQSMTDMMEAVAAIGPRLSSATGIAVPAVQTARSATREMGGGEAVGIKVITTSQRVSSTEMLNRSSVADAVAESEEWRPRPAAKTSGKLILIGVGLAVGVAAALFFAMADRKAPSVSAKPVSSQSTGVAAPPAPAPTPAPPPPPASTSAPAAESPPGATVAVPGTNAVAEPVAPDSVAKKGARASSGDRNKKATYRRIVAPNDDGIVPPPGVPGGGPTSIPGLKNPFQGSAPPPVPSP